MRYINLRLTYLLTLRSDVEDHVRGREKISPFMLCQTTTHFWMLLKDASAVNAPLLYENNRDLVAPLVACIVYTCQVYIFASFKNYIAL